MARKENDEKFLIRLLKSVDSILALSAEIWDYQDGAFILREAAQVTLREDTEAGVRHTDIQAGRIGYWYASLVQGRSVNSGGPDTVPPGGGEEELMFDHPNQYLLLVPALKNRLLVGAIALWTMKPTNHHIEIALRDHCRNRF